MNKLVFIINLAQWPVQQSAFWMFLAIAALATISIAVALWAIALKRRLARQVRNVTETGLIEEKIEKRYRDLFENANDIIYTTDLGGNFTSINKAAEQITGYSREEAMKMNMAYVVLPERIAQARDAIARILQGESVPAYELEIVAKDGRPLALEVNSRLMHEDGKPIGIQGIARDLTERKRMKEALRRSETRYRAFAEHSTEAIWCFEVDEPMPITLSEDGQIDYFYQHGSLIECNMAMAQMYGFSSAEEFLGVRLGQLLIPSEPRNIEYLRAFIRSGYRLTDAESTGVDRYGGQVYFLNNLVGIVESGMLLRAWGTRRDITTRKLAEDALRESEERFRTIVEASSEWIWSRKVDGRMTYNSPAIEAILGYSPEELLGTDNLSLLHAEDRKEIEEWLPAGIAEKRGWTGQVYRWRHKDGSYRFLESNGAPILNDKGEVTGFRGVDRDITERKRAEAELQKAKEAAEAANRAKSEFLANVSHEIRTPMNGIMGMTILALDTDLTQEQREYMELVKASASSLMNLINEILDFSKIETGKLKFDLDDFSLRSFLDKTMRALAVRAQEKGLKIEWEVSEDAPNRLVGDIIRLRQIVINLVSNAIKFTERGEIALRVHKQWQTNEATELRFEVADTGIGIPAEKLSRIFEAFEQADGSTTRKYGGAGLGLAISSRLAEMMEGRIWVESEPGRGSTFYFTARFEVDRKREIESARPQTTEHTPAVWLDRSAILSQIDGDTKLLQEIVDLFLESCLNTMAKMREAVALGDSYSLERFAYSLKGAAGIFQVNRFIEVAAHLEAEAREGKLGTAQKELHALEQEFERIKPALLALKQKDAALTALS